MNDEGVPARVRLRPELLDDLTEAFTWYEARDAGVGHDLVRSFFAAVARVSRQPQTAREVYGGFRRVRLRRYPHSLYYRVEEMEIVFFLLFHHARDPKHLKSTSQTRRAS